MRASVRNGRERLRWDLAVMVLVVVDGRLTEEAPQNLTYLALECRARFRFPGVLVVVVVVVVVVDRNSFCRMS